MTLAWNASTASTSWTSGHRADERMALAAIAPARPMSTSPRSSRPQPPAGDRLRNDWALHHMVIRAALDDVRTQIQAIATGYGVKSSGHKQP